MYEEGVIIETAQTQLEIIELEPQEALKQHEPTRTIESSEIESSTRQDSTSTSAPVEPTSKSPEDIISATRYAPMENQTIDIEGIQAVLCGALTRYVIQYGTYHQSSIATAMLENSGVCSLTSSPAFPSHLQNLYDIAGEYLWVHAMRHFRVIIRPNISGLRLNDAALEKAMSVVNKRELAAEASDCSLVTFGRPRTGIRLREHDIFEQDESFE
jgi:hypothetical protein